MDKSYAEAMIRFLENIKPRDVISKEKGQELCGHYWSPIRKELNKKVLVLYEGGRAYVKYDRYLSSTLAEYRSLLSNINKADEDRELDIYTKQISNKYAKRAYWLSVIAVFISLAAIVVEILSKTIWKG